jgi:hypothetical protein
LAILFENKIIEFKTKIFKFLATMRFCTQKMAGLELSLLFFTMGICLFCAEEFHIWGDLFIFQK